MEDTGRNIMQIKETIEKEKQRIYSIEQNITTAKNTQNDELKNIDSLTRTLSEINAQRESLLNKSSTIETDLTIANKKELIRKNDISIHKRLSQALSCITFIIIGIPLGIKLRSGNLMIGFGASFLVILFFILPVGGNGNCTGGKLNNASDTCLMGCKYYPFYRWDVYFQKTLYDVNSPYNILDFY